MASSASRCGPPSVSKRWKPRPARAASAIFRSTLPVPATITSACSATAARCCSGACSLVRTIVRASGGAAVSSSDRGSRLRRPEMTAIGGVAVRPARSPGWIEASCAGR